jgi:hypothetical protein
MTECESCNRGLKAFYDSLQAFHHDWDGVDDKRLAECDQILLELKEHLKELHQIKAKKEKEI